MATQPVEINPKREKEQELRSNIAFYLRHLSLAELRIIYNISHDLAKNYSDSYKEYMNNLDRK